ncbi:MAG: type III pantothenate kinase [Bacteroidales bacterium]|nr:type III pantothenate kinase [Bacteroidales bacterium]MBR0170913.1 type III pantothenate kinase [Bacteroidales bacterium]
MNLTLDIGNTAVKWATFEGRTMLEHGYDLPTDKLTEAEAVLACVSGALPDTVYDIPLITADTSLPIRLDYKTPATLGADRIAAACGAWSLYGGKPCLIVDAGTCITVDFLDAEGVYHGGAIMPGLQMNLQALHTFTAKLPLIDIRGVNKAPVLGRTTEESILAGTLGATMLALGGFVALYKQKAPGLVVTLTGGDADRLTAAGASGWELQPNLTMIGLNEIMINNEK